jgi:MobC-like protein
MKKSEKELRKHFVKTRMNDNEVNLLLKLQQKTTEKDTSSYLRKVALQKPVTVKYRNESADDFLLDMLNLKKELNAIGNNFNQAVHKLHLLDKIPEFRVWVQQYDGLQKVLFSKVDEIKLRMNQLYEQWLQK